MIHSKAVEIAKALCDQLNPYCEKIAIAGSVRRRNPEVKDIEIVCIPKTRGVSLLRQSGWINTVYGLGRILKGKLKDGRYIQLLLPEGIKLDLFVASPANWGMIYLIRTGSADFSKRILYEFKKRGYKSDGGYPTDSDGRRLTFESEEAIFAFLKIRFVRPDARNEVSLQKVNV